MSCPAMRPITAPTPHRPVRSVVPERHLIACAAAVRFDTLHALTRIFFPVPAATIVLSPDDAAAMAAESAISAREDDPALDGDRRQVHPGRDLRQRDIRAARRRRVLLPVRLDLPVRAVVLHDVPARAARQ